MDKRKSTLIYGLLVLFLIELSIWGMLQYGINPPSEEKTAISSIIENTLNKALLNLGITEANIVQKYWVEKDLSQETEDIEIHEEFVVNPSVSLNKVLKTIDENVKKAGGRVLSYNFLEEGKKLQISLGKGNISTHSLIISKKRIPRIAIVIDDMGYGGAIEKEILKLPYPLNISVFPNLRNSKTIAKTAYNSGFEVLVHQPLESKNPAYNTMPGVITTDMDKEKIKSILTNNLQAIPYAVGANNHEGSKAMEEEKVVAELITSLKGKNMFFLDSLTTPDSCAKEIAAEKNVTYLARDTFLDNEKSQKYIEEQIWELASQAISNGQAIGIAHPGYETLNALKNTLPKLEAEGIKIVHVSELIEE
jgi:polysaccharide deacetylase 2 family uncharacterized protein YibQ